MDVRSGQRRRPAVCLIPLLLLIVACAYGLLARLPYLWHAPGYPVGLYGMIARNYVKYGYPDLGLAQITSPGPPLPRREREQYQTHPPLVPLLSSASVALFGPAAWAVRLPHLLCGLGTVVVLAALAGRVGGWPAAAASAVVGALLPIAVWFGGAFPDVLGPALVLWSSLAVLLYALYCESGRWGLFALLVGSCVLALLSDWPAYVLCFMLPVHAFLYRSKARRWAMVALPVLAVACFALLWLYAHSVPLERNLYDTALGGAGGEWGLLGTLAELRRLGLAWPKDFAGKFLRYFSPLVLLSVLWFARRTWRAVWTRESRVEQFVLLLWLWPVAFTVAFPLIFFAHSHYHLLYLPAVAVTLGLLGGRLFRADGSPRRWRSALVAVAGCYLLLGWSRVTLGSDERTRAMLRCLQRRQAAWSADIRGASAPDQPSAFVLPFALQMRFAADRRVRGKLSSVAAVREAAVSGSGVGRLLFAPTAYPFGDEGFGEAILARYPCRAGPSTLAFALDGGPATPPVPVRRAAAVLEGQIAVDDIRFATFLTAGRRQYLYLGVRASGVAGASRFAALDWEIRFCDGGGRCVGTDLVPTRPRASYFVAVPPGWSWERGRVEMRLLDGRPPAAGLAARAARIAVRVLSLGLWGAPDVRVRALGIQGGSPIILEANPSAGARDGQLGGS